jgi:hypothetical protein
MTSIRHLYVICFRDVNFIRKRAKKEEVHGEHSDELEPGTVKQV